MKIIRKTKRYLKKNRGKNSTRSYGLLERFLAGLRARMACKFISKSHREGRLVDVGCGSYPIFLLTTKFVEKYGIDKNNDLNSSLSRRLKIIEYDIESEKELPFKDKSADVVTMLAVIEHLEYDSMVRLLGQIYRILKSEGICIITVPSFWSDKLLKIMSNIHLLSKAEISDHKVNLKSSEIVSVLENSGFKDIRFGYFELFMNRWIVARKT
jgi:ubiquinone/menaquinone biosynthesis C-methylase UbiE